MGRILILLVAVFTAQFSFAQNTQLEVLILNSGDFSDPTNSVVLQSYNTTTNTYSAADTIHTPSAQQILVDGDVAFIAAQDSIVKIDLNTMARLAVAEFPGTSTYNLVLHDSLLLAGNFYGQTDSNLYVFNKNNLQLLAAIQGLTTGVKGAVVLYDTLYVSQNYTSSSYSDSAGYIAVVELTTFTHVRDIDPASEADLGRLFVYNNQLLAISSVTDSVFYINPSTNAITGYAIGDDILGNYGSAYQIVDDTLLAIFNNSIGAFNLNTNTLLTSSITDSLVSAFVYDTEEGMFYATYTDFWATNKAYVFDHNGDLLEELTAGFAPENVALWRRTITGVSQPGNDLVLGIYPNPANSTLFVNSNQELTNLYVTGITGQVVVDLAVVGPGMQTIDVTHLPQGAYIVVAQTESGIHTARFIKQ